MNRESEGSSTNKELISLRRIIELISNYGIFLLLKKSIRLFFSEGLSGVKRKIEHGNIYNLWVQKHAPSAIDRDLIMLEIKEFNYQPLISIIVPVYNIKAKYLRECLDSVINQLYQNWERGLSKIPDR